MTAENAAERLEELRLTADMTPEQIGHRYTEVISRWTMAGATPEVWDKQFNEMLDDEALALEIAKKHEGVRGGHPWRGLQGDSRQRTLNVYCQHWKKLMR